MQKKLCDYILAEDDALPELLAQALLAEYAESGEWQDYADQNYGGGSSILISNLDVIGSSQLRRKLHDQIATHFSTVVAKYHARFQNPETGESYVALTESTGFRLLRYELGQQMLNHVDKHPSLGGNTPGWPLISCTINLNDDYTGGHLVFLDGEVTIKPHPGQAVLFPSNFLFPHKITPVTQGTRYAIVTWVF